VVPPGTRGLWERRHQDRACLLGDLRVGRGTERREQFVDLRTAGGREVRRTRQDVGDRARLAQPAKELCQLDQQLLPGRLGRAGLQRDFLPQRLTEPGQVLQEGVGGLRVGLHAQGGQGGAVHAAAGGGEAAVVFCPRVGAGGRAADVEKALDFRQLV